MFGEELVPPVMPHRSGIPPLVRDVNGPGPHSQGIIAKQPGSNWLRRKQVLDKRRAEQLIIANAKDIKNVIVATRQRRFEQKTDRRNFISKLQAGVKEGLKAAEEDLQKRRNILRDLILREEGEYTREYVDKSTAAKSERIEDMKKALEEIRLKNEAERKKLVEEKRLQQYKARCEELRIKIIEYNRKQINAVHVKQMEEKLAKKEAEKERDLMFYNLMVKDLEAMEEYENQRSGVGRALQMKEIAECYEKSIESKRLLAEEELRLKREEANLMKLLEEEMAKEKQEEQEEKKKKRERLREEILQQVKQSKELLDWKKKQERDIDHAFCKLIQDELDKEKAKQTDTKVQNRREFELYQAHLDKMRMEQIEEEKKANELRDKEMVKINDAREEIRCNRIRATQKMLEETIKVQGLQMEEKKQRLKQELELKKNEDAEILKQVEEYKMKEDFLNHEKKMKSKLRAKELKDQSEVIRMLREKEKAEEDARDKKEMMAEEQYLRSLNIDVSKTCDMKHPFYRVFEGTAH